MIRASPEVQPMRATAIWVRRDDILFTVDTNVNRAYLVKALDTFESIPNNVEHNLRPVFRLIFHPGPPQRHT